jgi:IS5 family transposase
VVAEESVLPDDRRPSRRNLEAVNQALLASAKQDRLESGATVRLDSTVSAAIMHQPSDSTLLWDAVRVMTRLLRQAQSLPGAPAVGWRDRRRAAKKRARATSTAAGRTRSAGSMAN